MRLLHAQGPILTILESCNIPQDKISRIKSYLQYDKVVPMLFMSMSDSVAQVPRSVVFC